MARRTTTGVLPLLVGLCLAAPSALAADPPSQLSHPPQRIADLWFAHNAILVMLGAAGRIAVTTDTAALEPWMFRVAPALRRATQLDGPVPTAETLLAAHVDLAFATPGSAAGAVAHRAGIPLAEVIFQNGDGLIRCVDQTAALLGDAHAADIARQYDAMLRQTVARLRDRTAPLTEARRPRVLHIQSLHPLHVDGGGTMIDEWIGLAGGRNVAQAVHGPMQAVSIEQIAAWNPDVIILGSQAGTLDPSRDGGVWRSIAAVRDGRVLTNPHGVFSWDRYGSEYPLQLLWAAKALHPDLFAGTNMAAETQGFYRRFFGYTLTPDETRRILAGQPPDAAGFPAQPGPASGRMR